MCVGAQCSVRCFSHVFGCTSCPSNVAVVKALFVCVVVGFGSSVSPMSFGKGALHAQRCGGGDLFLPEV